MTQENIVKLKEEVSELKNENINFYIDMLGNLINKQGVEIVFSGTISNGKSTVVNAILEQDLLQMGIGSTTAKITYISRGIDGVVGVLDNGDEIAKALESKNIKELNENRDVKIVKIEKEDFKYSNITFVDSPGINDINKLREDISYAYVPMADIVVFVLDISKGITADEKSFFDDKVIKTHKDKIFILLNGLDKIDGEDLSPVLNNPLLDGYKLFPISAKQYLVGSVSGDDKKIDNSKFKIFLDEFHSYISSIDGYKILNDRIDKSVNSVKELSKLQINSMITNLSKSKDELEIELNKTNQEKEIKEKEVVELRGKLESEILDIKNYINESISKIKKELETSEDINKTIEDIKKSVQDIITYSKSKLNSIEVDMGALANILNTISKHFDAIVLALSSIVTKISPQSAIFATIISKLPVIKPFIEKASGLNSKDNIKEILNGVETHFEAELNRLQKEESVKLELETLAEVKTIIHSLELSLNENKSEKNSINEDIDKMNKSLENILSYL